MVQVRATGVVYAQAAGDWLILVPMYNRGVWMDAAAVRATKQEMGTGRHLELRFTKGGQGRLDWIPVQGRKRVIKLNAGSLRDFIRTTGPESGDIRVVLADPSRPGPFWSGDGSMTLAQLLKRIVSAYPSMGFQVALGALG